MSPQAPKRPGVPAPAPYLFHPTCRLRGSTTCQTRRIKSVSSEPRSGPSAPAVAPNKTTSDWGSGQGSVAESTAGSGPGGGGGGGGGVMAAEEGAARPHARGPTRRTHAQTDRPTAPRGAWAGSGVLGAAPAAAGCSGSCRDPPAVPFGAGRRGCRAQPPPASYLRPGEAT